MDLAEYLKNHVALLVIMILFVLMIAALVVWLVILLYQKRKKTLGDTPPDESAKEDLSSEQVPAETSEEAPKEHDNPSGQNEPDAKDEEAPLKEATAAEEKKNENKSGQEKTNMKKPDKKPEPEKKTEQKSAPAKPMQKAKPAPAKTSAAGKWVLYEEDRGGFGFKLLASNGEVMLKSSSPYTSMQSAKAGIKTYQDNIAAGRLEVVETKKGNFFVQVNNASKRMLATSADYSTRSSCESALASIKRWAASTTIATEEEE